MNVLKMAMPLVQRILPLLDGNFGTAISNVLASQMQKPRAAGACKPGAHRAWTGGVADANNADLRDQVVDNTSLKRVEDHLEMVREAHGPQYAGAAGTAAKI